MSLLELFIEYLKDRNFLESIHSFYPLVTILCIAVALSFIVIFIEGKY